MSGARLSVAFMPLVDAAPLVVAREMGFAGEEGIDLELISASSWSQVRDYLAFGRVEAAHMLSPLPVAMALGLGGVSGEISVPMALSVNGNSIGVSRRFEKRLQAAGHSFSFDDAGAAGAALVAVADDGPLRIGVPFPFSMHAELLHYWLKASGHPNPKDICVRTVPPPLMADALAADEIDIFCVGEPWGSVTVENEAGALLLPGRAIWSAAPEKVLTVRAPWAEREVELLGRLVRAIWRASRWLGEGGAKTTAAELLARPEYLNMSPELIDRALTGKIVISPNGETRACPGFVEFYDGAANFPWKSQAAWIAAQMAGRLGLDRAASLEAARSVFRTDLYRSMLREAGAILPGASEKTEGGIKAGTVAASETGRLILAENRFFDGGIFDPAA